MESEQTLLKERTAKALATELSWKTAEKAPWPRLEKLLNTNPTASFTAVTNMAARVSLAGLEGEDRLSGNK